MLTSPLFRILDAIYGLIVKVGSNLQSLLLLYLRITWGHQLFMTGIADLKNIDPLIAALRNFSFPAPVFHAHEFAIVETVGGILLFFGLMSRLAAIPTFLVMLGILTTMHGAPLSDLRFVTDPLILTIQRPYPFMLTALIVFIFGPGRISIDALIKRWLEKQFRY
ncbi:MAG TPA: DoxX family protein [Chlamydiales bacterium]|nr:DoxX family protein [Chlamydiales bacterium]